MLEDEVTNSTESRDVTEGDRSLKAELYNFNYTTILLSIQIFPSPEETSRTALLAIGIKGEAPITTTTTLEDLSRSPAISQSLERLKQALPQIASTAKGRVDAQLNETFAQRSLSLPNPSPSTSTNEKSPNSNQLSLF